MLNITEDEGQKVYIDQMCFVIECWGRRLRFLQENGMDITSVRGYTIEDLVSGKADYWWRTRRDIIYQSRGIKGMTLGEEKKEDRSFLTRFAGWEEN